MNYLVGIALLAGLREEHCFWLLTTITENWCRYFDVNLTSLKIDLQVRACVRGGGGGGGGWLVLGNRS